MDRKKSYNASELMAKIKLVKGENFVTIEHTKSLTDQELIDLIPYLMNQSFIKASKNVNILVDRKFSKETATLLSESKEAVMVKKMTSEDSYEAINIP